MSAVQVLLNPLIIGSPISFLRSIPWVAVISLIPVLVLGIPSIAKGGEQSSLPASHVRTGFSLEESQRLAAQANLASLLAGGDVALYWTGHVSEFMPTAVVPRVAATRMLEFSPDPRIGATRAESALGSLSLDEFLTDPRSFAQGFIVVHRGRIVYEKYPGMHEEDNHLWASNAKTMVSLLIDLLIEDGTLDQNQTYGHYMPEFRDTVWQDIRLIDILDMTPGLDTEEDARTRSDPNSIAIRLFLSEFGEPNVTTGKVETTVEILKSARKIREPGTSFDYGSPVTQALVLLTEEVTQKKWADLFQERVWSKMGVEGDLQIHLASDGTAAGHGIVSSRLRDMARFGMLYTPSWNQITDERIVTPDIIQRIREGVRGHEFFIRGYDGPVFTDRLNARILGNSRQWDAVFEDGDFFKGGMMGQGLYVSPRRDLVIAFFSSVRDSGPIYRYLRPLANSKIFTARP